MRRRRWVVRVWVGVKVRVGGRWWRSAAVNVLSWVTGYRSGRVLHFFFFKKEKNLLLLCLEAVE